METQHRFKQISEQKFHYEGESCVELNSLIIAPFSLRWNTQNTMDFFCYVKMETLEALHYTCLRVLQKIYYNAWPMCVVFLHWDELHGDLTIYKITIFSKYMKVRKSLDMYSHKEKTLLSLYPWENQNETWLHLILVPNFYNCSKWM